MNPLIVFFFVAIILEDLLFKEGKLLKYLTYSIICYWVVNIFAAKAPFYSASNKIALATYSQSYDPTIYVKINQNTQKAKEFIAKFEKETGKRITMTLFFAKCLAEVYKNCPEVNQSLKFGSLFQKKTVDFSVLVDMGGKVEYIINNNYN